MENLEKFSNKSTTPCINNRKPFRVKESKSKLFRNSDGMIKIGFINKNQNMSENCVFITQTEANSFFADCRLANGAHSKDYTLLPGTSIFDHWNSFITHRWKDVSAGTYIVESVMEVNRTTKEHTKRPLISSVPT